MIFEKIKELLAEHLDIDADTINEDTTFEDLEVDSLDTVEIIMEIEEEFDIKIEYEDVGKSVGSLVEYVEKACEEK